MYCHTVGVTAWEKDGPDSSPCLGLFMHSVLNHL